MTSGFAGGPPLPLTDLAGLPPPRPPRPLEVPLFEPRNAEPDSEPLPALPNRVGPGWLAHIDAPVPPFDATGTAVEAMDDGNIVQVYQTMSVIF